MSLQFIIGGSGSGKSTYAYTQLIEESLRYPQRQFYCIVPEQFTMSTQQKLVSLHPGGGILNIDVLSLTRLAYRIFEETGGESREILEDTGKSMVIQKIVQDLQGRLPYLGSQMHRPGCIDEAKSLISEFMQYEIGTDRLDELIGGAPSDSLLAMKLKDLTLVYESFREYLQDHYVTNEELLEVLLGVLPLSERLKGSVMVFDGFTGFTPVQVDVLRSLLGICRQIRVTVTMDPREPRGAEPRLHQLFYMSHEMIKTLSAAAGDIDEPVILDQAGRFEHAPALAFLEKNLFRYRDRQYPGQQQEIRLFAADHPTDELEQAARRIRSLVRTEGIRFGEIAVITGNMEDYGNIARHVFSRYQIPCFIDEKRNVLQNPFVEWILSALEIVTRNYTYESMFRYLRSGFACLDSQSADHMENYVRALGIRGKKKWTEPWTKPARGMEQEETDILDTGREAVMGELSALALVFTGGRKSIKEYCAALRGFIDGSGAPEKLKEACESFRSSGLKELEKEYSQIYGSVMGLLDKMTAVLGDESVSRSQFCQLIQAGLSQMDIGLIPPGTDQVLVGDMERSRLGEIKVLFFVGVNEGSIPKNPDTGGFLTQMDREYFASRHVPLSPGPRERITISKFYLYLGLTKPSRFLILSYSLSSGSGEPLRPASLVFTLKTLFPELKTEVSRGSELQPELPRPALDDLAAGLARGDECLSDPLFMELYSWYIRHEEYAPAVKSLLEYAGGRRPEDVIGRATAKALYGEISPYSATRLELYSACAMRHFLTYGLRLCERAEYEFRAVDLGNVMHASLERFSMRLRERGRRWADLADEERDTLVDECVEEVCENYANSVLGSSAREHYRITRIRRILRRTVWVLQQQLKNGDFEPDSFELAFEGGRIDRVDISREGNLIYVKIVDYKSGSTEFSLEKVYHGLQLQLVLYMDAAILAEQTKNPGCEVVPAGIFYYRIGDPMLEPKENQTLLEDALISRLKMDGLVHADPEVIHKLDRTVRTLPVSFNQDGSLSKRSAGSIATRQQFEALSRYVKKKIHTSLNEIQEGNCKAAPYRLGREEACTYCGMKEACGFDPKTAAGYFRNLQTMTPEEVFRQMEEIANQDENQDENQDGGQADGGQLDG